MPDDVKEMLGLPVIDKTKRSKSEPRTPTKTKNDLSSNSKLRQKSPTTKKSPQKAKSTHEIFYPPSVAEKFEQQEKRNQIDAFLNKSRSSLRSNDSAPVKSKKLSDVSLSLVDKIPPVDPPSETVTENIPTTKLNLADVIIAAAAAKTVKLKSKGKFG